ncbi:MAG: hypothetical protein F6J86_36165, partial [Symploca sp. SIO1B1]|nr:hypothetical protein [Symploca sp. SIO1B1]
GRGQEAGGRRQEAGVRPVHKYLRSVRTVNSNTETVKSYHCCLLPIPRCLPQQVCFRQACKV